MRVLFTLLALGSFSFEAHANALFGHTHLLPSPHTLRSGRLLYGTDMAFGVTDFFQVGTNVLRDFFKIYNANAKVSLLDFQAFALSPTFGFESYNLHDISDGNPDLRVTSFLPGAVTAFGVLDDVALFVGFNLNLTSTRLITDGITRSGYVSGARVASDLSWAYNRPEDTSEATDTPKRGARPKIARGVGHVLSGGVSYDINYKFFGVGLSHHWPGFHLGVHYYPAATRGALQPILAGGGALDF